MKSIFISTIITSVFLFTHLIVLAQDADKTVEIKVSGSGETQEDAKLIAFRSAIEQAFGTFISSKTEILNDNLIADQITSVASGNIQSFKILNESQLPDGSWGVTLNAIVSISKLTSFSEAKGIAIEIKGGLFALNIKQQLLNEQGEIKAIHEMIGLLHEPMQTSFNYEIKSGEPKSMDPESKNWEIPLTVTASANKNMDFCSTYLINTLAALSLSEEEVATYKNLNKAVFSVLVNFRGDSKIYNQQPVGLNELRISGRLFYLRKQSSINALNTLTSQWAYYTRLFTVNSGLDDLICKDEGTFHGITKGGSINLLSNTQQAAVFSWQDKRTLQQIEQMTGYSVKPRGVVSEFKHGGFVLYEKNGHGLIVSNLDLGYLKWIDAKTACENLSINGYDDWILPNREQIKKVCENIYKSGYGGLGSKWQQELNTREPYSSDRRTGITWDTYWTSELFKRGDKDIDSSYDNSEFEDAALAFRFDNLIMVQEKNVPRRVRAVRVF